MLAALSFIIFISALRLDAWEIFPVLPPANKVYLLSFGITAAAFSLGALLSGIPDDPWKIAKFTVPIFAISLLSISVNKRYFGLKLLAPPAGLLNSAVVVLNGWRMPVFTNGDADLMDVCYNSTFHSVATSATKLPWLADCLESRFIVENGVASIGDVFLFLALICTAVQLGVNQSKKMSANRAL